MWILFYRIFVDIFTFIATVVVVSASGALAPGPMFFTNITHGAKSGAKGGLAFSVGHTIFELSFVVFLAFTLETVTTEANKALINLVLGVAGGTALLVFGFLQIREAWTSAKSTVADKGGIPAKNPLLLGTVFTGLNPYFIIWWLTIGMTLLIKPALDLASFAGVFLMYGLHVWMDYAWLIGTAYLAKKGTNLAGRKGYRGIMIIFGAILIGYGLYFLSTALL